MRSLPRMNKQALMKMPEHFACLKDMENKRKVAVRVYVCVYFLSPSYQITEASKLMSCSEIFKLQECKMLDTFTISLVTRSQTTQDVKTVACLLFQV